MTILTPSQHRKTFLKNALFVWIFLSALVIGSSIWLSEGHLIYTLDDPYIHLSVAENIIRGGYGVNTNEFASPSSSILYPLILSLGEIIGAAQFTPLVLNIIATGFSVYILLDFFWYYVLPQETRSNNIFANLTAFLLILSISSLALPMTGMEHSLHVLVALATIRGLISLVEDDICSCSFMLVVIVGPLIRFEGLALSGASVMALLFLGHQRKAIGIILFIAGTITLYSVTMISLDLSILPSSVMVKSNVFVAGTNQSGIGNSLLALVANFRASLAERWGLIFLTAIIIAILIMRSDFIKRSSSHRKMWNSPKFIIGGVLILSLLAHIIAGRYDWFHRYEVYAVSIMILGMLYLLREKLRAAFRKNDRKTKLFFIGTFIFLIIPYGFATIATPFASRGIYEQQFQMHRFATTYFARPVAVNDLGWTSYKNDQYVLDLWGLGSETARKLRANNMLDANTIRTLVIDKNIDYAMIYNVWLGANIPSQWCLIAKLKSTPVTAASGTVDFYAATDFAKENMNFALEKFAKTLPKSVKLKRFTCS
ncbi:hypothetical protein [Kiloniella majae]|uniref:hypothetical protein n=1 Tax=Kiloniella majae TaxID=1938558 RepID=UPI000A276F5E|nr:hypothetical protein [Kiloniella majae]